MSSSSGFFQLFDNLEEIPSAKGTIQSQIFDDMELFDHFLTSICFYTSLNCSKIHMKMLRKPFALYINHHHQLRIATFVRVIFFAGFP